MSGFEIAGVLFYVQPLLTEGIPTARRVVKALCDSEKIKKKLADDVFGLFSEFELQCRLLDKLKASTPFITDSTVAAGFDQLFVDFGPAIDKVLAEGDRLCRKSLVGFAISYGHNRLEDVVSELERLMQRVSRRVMLLVHFIQCGVVSEPMIPSHTPVSSNYSHSPSYKPLNHPSLRFQTQNTVIRDRGDPEGGSIVGVHQLLESHDIYLSPNDAEDNSPREVAEKLAKAPPDLPGILSYHSYNYDSSQYYWDVIYHYPPAVPPSSKPQTLLSVLQGGDEYGEKVFVQPLNVRLRLAKQIASAVLFVHFASLVHKNIRPETILLFGGTFQSPCHGDSLGDAFLVGFDKSRGSAGKTLGITHHHDWDACLYCHPTHDGGPYSRYTMLHDIYALGVVLLQIGLWRSFVGPIEEVDEFEEDVFVRTVITRKPLPPFDALPGSQTKIQNRLIDCAYNNLPCSMGLTYTDIVLSCLKCVDHPGLVVGAWFIEDVLDRLDDIKF
ncbi:hypothetical protein BDV93DRAFT_552307 [Ceratobasidium sp. AG-I]|nr:hypothetical protein BDV93DRAFT_552307 [Ceratobasidium sp. AG-I]